MGWVTTNYLLTTMSRLVSFLMLLSLMVVVVNSMHAPMAHKTKRGSKSSSWSSTSTSITKTITKTKCKNGDCTTSKTECKDGKCSSRKGKREALDAPMAHKTKRGSKSSSRKSSSTSITKTITKTKCKNGDCTTSKTECK